MDPSTWQRQSILINHDHPYTRSTRTDPVNVLCVEPKYTHEPQTFTESDVNWIEIVKEDDGISFDAQPLEDSPVLAFFKNSPLDAPYTQEFSRNPSFKPAWNVIVTKLYANVKKFLVCADIEQSVGVKGDLFRRTSFEEIVMRRVARYIRKQFVTLNWRIESCADLHETLLNTLSPNLLLVYLGGFVCLMRQNKILNLLRRLNNETERRGFKRFAYTTFLESSLRPTTDDFFSSPPRTHMNQRPHDSLNGSLLPITFIPTNSSIGTSFIPMGSGRPSSTDDAIYVCVIDNRLSQSSRIRRMLRYLSHVGRTIVESVPDDMSYRVHQLRRQYQILTEDTRPVPIFFVGFGPNCLVVLRVATAILSPQSTPKNANTSALEDTLCGRVAEATSPTRPWLAGVVMIAPPLEHADFRPFDEGGHVGGPFSTFRRTSLLVVVGAKWRQEAEALRAAMVQSRQCVAGHEGWKPVEIDLRMLLIGGADHLLRMHPSSLKRCGTTQKAIDLAIFMAIKNLVDICRRLVNIGVAPVGSSGTQDPTVAHASVIQHSRNGNASNQHNETGNADASSFLSPWFTNTEMRRNPEAAVPRRAAILRVGPKSRGPTMETGSVSAAPQPHSLRPSHPQYQRQQHMIGFVPFEEPIESFGKGGYNTVNMRYVSNRKTTQTPNNGGRTLAPRVIFELDDDDALGDGIDSPVSGSGDAFTLGQLGRGQQAATFPAIPMSGSGARFTPLPPTRNPTNTYQPPPNVGRFVSPKSRKYNTRK